MDMAARGFWPIPLAITDTDTYDAYGC